MHHNCNVQFSGHDIFNPLVISMCYYLLDTWFYSMIQSDDPNQVLSTPEIANIEQAIDDQLLPRDVDRGEKENFFHFTRANQSRILLVLDGLDELNHEDLLQRLLLLIQGKVLSNIYPLLTGRPEMGAKVRRYCDSILQIVGYTRNDVNSYIEQYFCNHSDPSLAKKLKDNLDDDDQLRKLTSSPMNTALLCLLCEETNGIFPIKKRNCTNVLSRVPSEDTLQRGELT